MHSTSSLAAKLAADFPLLHFTPSDTFRWSPSQKTIYYIDGASGLDQLLHELGHALLSHIEYKKDIILIEMERDAWEYAKTKLAPRYDVTITNETVETALDSYRDWLHARSTCPSCQATGIQTNKDHYKCLACQTTWRVNDARICALRRYTN